ALALAVLVAACGGTSGTTSPETWANRLCTDLTAWLGTVKAGADQLRQAQVRATTLTQARAQLVHYLDTAVAATDQLLAHTSTRPKVADGKALNNEIRAGVEQARMVFEHGRAQARALPTNDPNAYRQPAQALGTEIARAGTGLQQRVSTATRRYRSAEID